MSSDLRVRSTLWHNVLLSPELHGAPLGEASVEDEIRAMLLSTPAGPDRTPFPGFGDSSGRGCAVRGGKEDGDP